MIAVAIAAASAAAIVLALITPDQSGLASTILACVAAGAAFAPVGALIVRRTGNAVGWTLLAIGAGIAISSVTLEYGIAAATGALTLPAWEWVVWIGLWSFLITAGSAALLCLLFPTGEPPGRRWRAVGWALVAGTTGSLLANAFNPVRIDVTESTAVAFPNPAGIDGLADPISVAVGAFGIVAIGAGLLCVASLVVRFRRASADDRARIKWLAYVVVVGIAFLLLGELVSSAVGCETTCGNAVFDVFYAGITFGIPLAVGAAILRHGLYDIDVVIRKTLVVGAIAVAFIAIYALVVGGVGALVQGASNSALSFAAAAIVAVLFQPLLIRARRFADLLVYGRRATPYEVLAAFSGVMAGVRANDVVLDEMARVVGEGAGAQLAEVWLRVDRDLHLAATWPDPAPEPPTVLALQGSILPEIDAEVVAPVTQQDELLGALTLSMPPSEPATDATRRLLADLGSQAGLVLRNVRLIEELRASRKRLVTAQDEERRRLERNIHDGAQQQLIALGLRLRLAAGTVESDPDATKAALTELAGATQEALDDLRALARGIYPPLLADRGLAAALASQASKAAIPVQVDADGIERYPQEIEAAVYFCSLEAMQNVGKYANATSAEVRLARDGDELTFTVHDDGAGFDPSSTGYGTGLQGMADRLAALGGTLDVRSTPGDGTTILGRLPVS